MNKEIETRLPSGITVYRYGNPDSHSFYISLFVKAGSMYESEKDSGITHFLEHAIIRNVNAVMRGGLYPLLDRYGIEFNASTYSEMVQFYVSGASEHFDIGAEIISKVLSPIVLSPGEISAEAARIRAEIRENDERSSLSGFTSGIVHAGTTLARSITGTPTSVGSITRSRLESYRKSVFTSGNVFLYLSGKVGEREEKIIFDTFSDISLENGVIRDNMAPVSRNFGKRAPEVHIKSADYTMLRFTFDMDMSHISVEESDLLYDTLLGGYSSRLFIELSEKRGIFYDISGATERYANIGTFSFFFEVKAGDVISAVGEVFAILEDIVKNGFSADECMKAGYVDNAYMLYDDVRETNFTFAYDNHILNAGYKSIEERRARYEAVTAERLRSAADRIFRPENLTLTAKGNKKRIDTDALVSLIKSFRS